MDYFTHLKLCFDDATNNFECVQIAYTNLKFA